MLPVIILFAKAPVPGRVKTRLSPAVDLVSAAELHRAFVLDMIESLLPLSETAELELSTDVSTPAWPEASVTRSLQTGGDLGARLYHALSRALALGHPRALVLGSDAPTLPPYAVGELLAAGADVALGPTEDGGYYGIACQRVHPEMFAGVRWSTPHTLADTAQGIRRCGLSVAFGTPWFDVDEPSDLERLRQLPALPRHTAAWFESRGARISRAACRPCPTPLPGRRPTPGRGGSHS